MVSEAVVFKGVLLSFELMLAGTEGDVIRASGAAVIDATTRRQSMPVICSKLPS